MSPTVESQLNEDLSRLSVAQQLTSGHSGFSDVWVMINLDGSQNIETAVPAMPDIVMTTLKEELE